MLSNCNWVSTIQYCLLMVGYTLTLFRLGSYTTQMAFLCLHSSFVYIPRWTHLAFSFKGLFTWSGGPRSSGVGFFCFHALGDTKQKKPTPLDRDPPLHVNGP